MSASACAWDFRTMIRTGGTKKEPGSCRGLSVSGEIVFGRQLPVAASGRGSEAEIGEIAVADGGVGARHQHLVEGRQEAAEQGRRKADRSGLGHSRISSLRGGVA